MIVRVLILEDRAADAELMVAELSRAGMAFDWRRVDTETDYVAALGPEVDVVLADYSVLGFEAPRALALLRERGLDVPFIVVSGTIDEDRAVHCMKAGASDYLFKDRLGRLAQAVQRALEERALGEAKRRADAALSESETRYRLITEHSNDAIFLSDMTGALIFANRRAEELMGYTADEFRGRSLLALVAPGSLAMIAARLAALAAGEKVPATFEMELIRKDGAGVWFEASATTVYRDGAPIGRLGIARDITERRRAQAELRLQAAALEAAANAIVLTAPDGTIIWVNPAFTRLTGYSAEEAVGANPRILKSGQHGPEFYQELWRTITDGRVWRGEMVNRRKDGTTYPERITITPVKDAAGAITHFVAVKEDVSEQQDLQARVLQSEKLATLGELIGGIAHELNNPLAVMVGHAQLLRRDATPGATARIDKLVDAAQRATRIVQNFLTFARRHKPEHSPVSVNEIVERTLELLAYQMRVANVRVEASLAPGLPPVAGDRYQLQQVFLNLVNNALQAMADAHGSGTLRVTSLADAARSRIDVAVADDGPGIPAEHLSRIGEPFFTTKSEGKGTGLGVAIARSIAVEHGGSLSAASAPGAGATFTVSLPVTSAAAAPAPAPVLALPSGLRVLAVDDEPQILDLVRDGLSARGAVVEVAASGREALEAIARARPDVLILDLRMPGMTGREVWREVRHRDPELARRTVFCTGAIDEHERTFLEASGCRHVMKPFDWQALFDTVARAAAR